ncbi:MAG: VCBS repeat-containing protein, partial [Roseibium sp.]
ITVTATSTDGSTSQETFTINVSDVDEADVSAVTDTDSSANTIAENAGEGASTGVTVSATDSDITDSVTYTVDDARFEVAADGTVTVAAGASFDYESEPTVSLTVTATSTDGSTSQETFSISVSDIAEDHQMSGNTFTDTGVAETTITGNDGADTITAHADGSTIHSGAGDDTVHGGDGDDTVNYGEGADTVYGGGGNDFIDDAVGSEPNSDANYLDGGAGNDTIYGGGGDDTIIGGEGNDSLSGESDNDTIDGGEGADGLYGGSGNDTLEGGAGNDYLDGGSDTDTAVYSGNWSDYSITENDNGSITIVDTRSGSPDGTDTVWNVENFRFADGDVLAGDLVAKSVSDVSDTDASANTIAEDATGGTSIGVTANATDENVSDTVSYTVDDARFEVADDGTVSVASGASFDAETESSIDITVTATSSDGSTSQETLTISVTDVNEAPTDISFEGNSNLPVSSGTVAGGTVIASVSSVSDEDAGETFSYSLTDDANGMFSIDSSTGEITVNSTVGDASFSEQTGSDNPFNGVDEGSYVTPTFADVDGDGDLDAFVGNDSGQISYFENTGSVSNPTFVEKTGSSNPFDGIDVGYDATPTFADIDGDGDLDAFVGEYNGNINYFENTGTTSSPSYTQRSGSDNPFDGVDVGSYSTISFADIDGDGDLDAFTGEENGTISYFQNTGTDENPTFTERTGSSNPLDGVDVGYDSAPIFADVDGDGDLDAVVGEWDGNLNYYENTGTTSNPTFTQRTGSDNPFDGIDIGNDSKIELVDIDGDGDLDAFVGDDSGNINYYENNAVSGPTVAEINGETVTVQVTDSGGETYTEQLGIHLGDDSANTITGYSHDDVIYGLGGNDTLNGGAGDDTIYTGSGGDTVDGGEGSDTIVLDDIDGGNTNTITDSGTSGTDTIELGTGSGTYRIQGDFSAAAGIEIIDGSGATGDQLGTNDTQANFNFSNVTLTGVDEIIGTNNNDTIVGSSGNDTISVKDGDDVITGGAGDDVIDGEGGTDTVVYSGNYADYTITDNGDSTYTITDNVGTDGSDTISNIETLRFADGDQSMSDLFGSNVGAVSDTDGSANSIHETAAAGTQVGITASATDADGDAVTYTLNDDRFEIDESGVVTIADHAFFDSQVESSIDLAVTATSSDGSTSTETFSVSVDGSYDYVQTGGTGSGSFSGSGQSYSVDGIGGSDTIMTGDYNDRIEGGTIDGNDTISSGGGRDLVFGQADNDTIDAGSGDDVIVGGAGNDTLTGGDGSDLFMHGLGDGSDTISAGAGVAWTDVIDLGGGPGVTSAGEYGTDWTITITDGSVESVDTDNGIVDLSQDADGYIDFADGSRVTFNDLEEIRW